MKTMRIKTLLPWRPASQQGLSLIELLVALVISVILSLVVYQVFDIAQRTSRLQAAIAQLQDSGRFALQTMAQDLRQTDFNGSCDTLSTKFHLESESGLKTGLASLMGWESADDSGFANTLANPVADSPLVTFSGVASTYTPTSPGGVSIESANSASQLKLSSSVSKQFQNRILLLEAGESCEVFFNNASQPDRLAKTRKNNAFTRNQSPGSSPWGVQAGNELVAISALDKGVYYLGFDPVNNLPSIMYLDISRESPSNQVVANHVAAMRILYLESGQYRPAASVTDWVSVTALRISLLMQSEESVRSAREAETLASEFGIGNFRGLSGAAAEDFTQIFSDNPQRLYQVFTTTVKLRNR
ncbi:prepilin-type N-terminal cleavage/methylation domain-containing protein [Halomonas sp. TBZ9]|uniref:Prepilin-type N-terminal cleavage/methylation domain-containing protein n=1 Tax=Vreelandella azerica TaxID=2732867 RepID=A0A7Y3XAD7_9GAMM|nr:PilW family protein [Halomonas azerica]NOG31080.1 prepilin-type N-terminal cleavage/methylation domain-containing protein [Halomonas azerica]